jgi:hypothetical protein
MGEKTLKKLPPPQKHLEVVDAEYMESIEPAEYERIVKENKANRFFKWLFFVLCWLGMLGLVLFIHTDWATLRLEVGKRLLATEQMEAKKLGSDFNRASPCGPDRFDRENLDWTIIKAIAKDENPFKGVH